MHVLLLGVPLFEGMAGSVRVRNLLYPLIQENKISWSNLYFSKLAGNYKHPDALNVQEVELDISSIKSISNFLKGSFKFIKRRNDRNQSNILYAYDTPDLKSIFLILYAKSQGYKIILDIVEDNRFAASYGGFWNRLRIKSGQFLVFISPFYADLAIGISNHLLVKLSDLYKDLSKVVFIPVTVDLDEIQMLNQLDRPVKKVFYGGSFGKKDGVELLVGAFENLQVIFPKSELVLTGKSDNQDDFEEFLELIGNSYAANSINYLGFLSTEEYHRVLRDCDVFCVIRNKSQAANTGFPSKLAEFLAAGRAVIASDVGDIRSLLKDGKDLILVPPENEVELFKALLRIFQDPALSLKLGKAGRKAAKENFDNRKYSVLLLEKMKFLN